MTFLGQPSVTRPVPALLGVILGLAMAGCGGPAAYRESYSDERPKVIGEQDGRRPVGTWSRYHADGSLASLGGYRDGQQSGRWTYGHPGGIPAGVGHFTAGIQDGWWQILDDHGHLLTAGLMAQGQRVGPWLSQRDGRLTSTLYTPIDHLPIVPHVTPDSITWQLDPATLVRFTAVADPGAVTYVVDASWNSVGSPLRLVLPDPDVGPLFLELTKSVIPPASVSATADSATASTSPSPNLHVAGAAQSPEGAAETAPGSPASTAAPLTSGQSLDNPQSMAVAVPGVSLSPIPEQAPITGVYRLFADRFVAGFLAGTPATPANAQQLAKEAPVGDPLGEALVGKPLPQTRFLTSSGGVLDLAHPAKPTVLVIMRGFSNSICLYCTSQTAAIMKAEGEFKAAGVDVAILYPGSADSVPKFLASARDMTAKNERNEIAKPFPVPVLFDVNLQLVRTLHIEAELARPTTLVIGVDGLVKWAYVGRSMSDRPTLKDALAVALATR